MPSQSRPAHRLLWACLLLLAGLPPASPAASCTDPGVHLQVLGAGGPELDDGRASSGYLLWQDGRARVLVDMGAGSLLRFEQGGARVEDLDVVLLSHLHVDHSADLPALIKGSYFSSRLRDLPLFGPTGNRLMPGTVAFVHDLFGARHGAFRYLSDYLDGGEAYRLRPAEVPADGRALSRPWQGEGLRVAAVPVHHGPVPALAWRVALADRVVVFSGDMNGDNHTLAGLARGADLLVAHHAIPEGAGGVARELHMPPSVIGRIAAEAGVRQLLLSHRMKRTLGHEAESTAQIRRHYAGPLAFAEDGRCYTP